jgi:chemotaxis protein methyltransferase CheR
VSESALAAAAALLGRRVGLRLEPAVRGRLLRCLQDEAAARHQDPDSYVASLSSDAEALQALLDRVTVQETSFFRDPGQFDVLATEVLPTLASPVVVWSAGCANGQEPYSLAMTLAEAGLTDFLVVATDISTKALERTRLGRYAERELRGLSTARRERFLVPAGQEWEIVGDLRKRIRILQHNLVSDPPPFPVGRCQVVFCRNVLIYFRQPEVVAFLDRTARWLPPGGWLFLGYSESLWQVTDVFALVRLGESFVYRLPSPASPSPPPVRPETSRRSQPAPAPAPVRKRAPAASAPAPAVPERLPSVSALMASGELAAAEGDLGRAIAAFRQAAYVDPDQPISHLHLGLVLEESGDVMAARRAYGAARAALTRCDTAAVEAALEGYGVVELARLLDTKLGVQP